MESKAKGILAVLLIALSAIAGYWYYSPYLALKSMRTAVDSRNADQFNEHVDYPKLRESLKGQMSAKMAEQMGQSSPNGFAALGAMLGVAMVNQFVDAFVRPEVIMRAMQQGEIKDAPSATPNPDTTSKQKNTEDFEWDLTRYDSNKIIVYGRKQSETSANDRPGFVFERYGFADWKLTEIRLAP